MFSLNTYCLDVMQKRSAEVVAGNYFIRYMFACAGTAICIPAIDAFGVGWFSTISAGFLIASAVLTWLVTLYGRSWRERVDRYNERRQARHIEEKNERHRRVHELGEVHKNSVNDDEHEREEHE